MPLKCLVCGKYAEKENNRSMHRTYSTFRRSQHAHISKTKELFTNPREARYSENVNRHQRLPSRDRPESTQINLSTDLKLEKYRRKTGYSPVTKRSCYAASLVRNNRKEKEHHNFRKSSVTIISEERNQIRESCSNTTIVSMDLGTDEEDAVDSNRQDSISDLQTVINPKEIENKHDAKDTYKKCDINCTVSTETGTKRNTDNIPQSDECGKKKTSGTPAVINASKSALNNKAESAISFPNSTNTTTKISDIKQTFTITETSSINPIANSSEIRTNCTLSNTEEIREIENVQSSSKNRTTEDLSQTVTIAPRDPRLHKINHTKEILNETGNIVAVLAYYETIYTDLVDPRTDHKAYKILNVNPVELKIPEFSKESKKFTMKPDRFQDSRRIRKPSRITIRNRSSVCSGNLNKIRRFYKKPIAELMKFCCHVSIRRNECKLFPVKKSPEINLALIDTKKSYLAGRDVDKNDPKMKEGIETSEDESCCNPLDPGKNKVVEVTTSSVDISCIDTKRSYITPPERMNTRVEKQDPAGRKYEPKSSGRQKHEERTTQIRDCSVGSGAVASGGKNSPHALGQDSDEMKLSTKEHKDACVKHINSTKRKDQREGKEQEDRTSKEPIPRRKSISSDQKNCSAVPHRESTHKQENEVKRRIAIQNERKEGKLKEKEKISRTSIEKHKTSRKENGHTNSNKVSNLDTTASRRQQSHRDPKIALEKSKKLVISRGTSLKREIPHSTMNVKRRKTEIHSSVNPQTARSMFPKPSQATVILESKTIKVSESNQKYHSFTVPQAPSAKSSSSIAPEIYSKPKIPEKKYDEKNCPEKNTPAILSSDPKVRTVNKSDEITTAVSCKTKNCKALPEEISLSSGNNDPEVPKDNSQIDAAITLNISTDTSDCSSKNKNMDDIFSCLFDEVEYSLHIPEGSKSNSKSCSDISSEELLRSLEESIESIGSPSKGHSPVDVDQELSKNPDLSTKKQAIVPSSIEHCSLMNTSNSEANDEKVIENSHKSSEQIEKTSLAEKSGTEITDEVLDQVRKIMEDSSNDSQRVVGSVENSGEKNASNCEEDDESVEEDDTEEELLLQVKVIENPEIKPEPEEDPIMSLSLNLFRLQPEIKSEYSESPAITNLQSTPAETCGVSAGNDRLNRMKRKLGDKLSKSNEKICSGPPPNDALIKELLTNPPEPSRNKLLSSAKDSQATSNVRTECGRPLQSLNDQIVVNNIPKEMQSKGSSDTQNNSILGLLQCTNQHVSYQASNTTPCKSKVISTKGNRNDSNNTPSTTSQHSKSYSNPTSNTNIILPIQLNANSGSSGTKNVNQEKDKKNSSAVFNDVQSTTVPPSTSTVNACSSSCPSENASSAQKRRIPQMSNIACRATVDQKNDLTSPQETVEAHFAVNVFKIVNAYILSKCRGRYLIASLEHLNKICSVETEVRNVTSAILKIRDVYADILLKNMQGLPMNMRNYIVFISFFMEFLLRAMANEKAKPYLSFYIWELLTVHCNEYDKNPTLKYFKTYIENDVKAHQKIAAVPMTIEQYMMVKSQIYHYFNSLRTPLPNFRVENSVGRSTDVQNSNQYVSSQSIPNRSSYAQIGKNSLVESTSAVLNKESTYAVTSTPSSFNALNRLLSQPQQHRTTGNVAEKLPNIQQGIPANVVGNRKRTVDVPCSSSCPQQCRLDSSHKPPPTYEETCYLPKKKPNNTRIRNFPNTFTPYANQSVRCPNVVCCPVAPSRPSDNMTNQMRFPTNLPTTSNMTSTNCYPNQTFSGELNKNIVSSATVVPITASRITTHCYPNQSVSGIMNKNAITSGTGSPTTASRMMKNCPNPSFNSASNMNAMSSGTGFPITASRMMTNCQNPSFNSTYNKNAMSSGTGFPITASRMTTNCPNPSLSGISNQNTISPERGVVIPSKMTTNSYANQIFTRDSNINTSSGPSVQSTASMMKTNCFSNHTISGDLNKNNMSTGTSPQIMASRMTNYYANQSISDNLNQNTISAVPNVQLTASRMATYPHQTCTGEVNTNIMSSGTSVPVSTSRFTPNIIPNQILINALNSNIMQSKVGDLGTSSKQSPNSFANQRWGDELNVMSSETDTSITSSRVITNGSQIQTCGELNKGPETSTTRATVISSNSSPNISHNREYPTNVTGNSKGLSSCFAVGNKVNTDSSVPAAPKPPTVMAPGNFHSLEYGGGPNMELVHSATTPPNSHSQVSEVAAKMTQNMKDGLEDPRNELLSSSRLTPNSPQNPFESIRFEKELREPSGEKISSLMSSPRYRKVGLEDPGNEILSSSRLTPNSPQNPLESTRFEKGLREPSGETILSPMSSPREPIPYPTPPISNGNAQSESIEEMNMTSPSNDWKATSDITNDSSSPHIEKSEEKPHIDSSLMQSFIFSPESSICLKNEPDELIDLTCMEDDEIKLEPSHDGYDLTLEEPMESLLILHNRKCLCGQEAIYLCACNTVMYCSQECQFKDWDNHQRLCPAGIVP